MSKTHTVHGRFSKADMGNTDFIFKPWAADQRGLLRPQSDSDALQFSLELAASSYDLNLTPFLNSGWADVSVQAETKLFTGMQRPSTDLDATEYVKNRWSWFRSKRDATHTGFFSQVTDALRQFKASDSGKILFMGKKHADGKYVIAIGFMGTSNKLADWFANLRMTTENGFHKGFYQLARQLESNEAQILFPTIAGDLSLEKLSLADILKECKSADSRFRILMAGHSQGGAIMQVYTHFKIHESNIAPSNLLGYGFASPSCAIAQAGIVPGAYPLFHILNSDDYVPHMGSQVHYGLMMTYPASQSIRSQCYTWSLTPEAVELRAKLRRITAHMVDTASCMEYGMAFLNAMLKVPVDDLHDSLGELRIRFLPIKTILSFTDRMDYALIELIERQTNIAYTELTGAPMDSVRLAAIQKEIDALVDEVGIKKLSAALGQLLLNPHHLVTNGSSAYGSYQYIAKEGVPDLRHSIWAEGPKPKRIWYESPATQNPSDLQVRRRPPAGRRAMPAPKGIPAYSAKHR